MVVLLHLNPHRRDQVLDLNLLHQSCLFNRNLCFLQDYYDCKFFRHLSLLAQTFLLLNFLADHPSFDLVLFRGLRVLGLALQMLMIFGFVPLKRLLPILEIVHHLVLFLCFECCHFWFVNLQFMVFMKLQIMIHGFVVLRVVNSPLAGLLQHLEPSCYLFHYLRVLLEGILLLIRPFPHLKSMELQPQQSLEHQLSTLFLKHLQFKIPLLNYCQFKILKHHLFGIIRYC